MESSENRIRLRAIGLGQASGAKEFPGVSLEALRDLREDIADFLIVISHSWKS